MAPQRLSWMGGLVFLAINFAVLNIGSQVRAGAGARDAVSLAVTSDPVPWSEWAAIAAISGGVYMGARPAKK